MAAGASAAMATAPTSNPSRLSDIALSPRIEPVAKPHARSSFDRSLESVYQISRNVNARIVGERRCLTGTWSEAPTEEVSEVIEEVLAIGDSVLVVVGLKGEEGDEEVEEVLAVE